MRAIALKIYFGEEFNFKAMVVSYYVHAVLNSLAKKKMNAINLLQHSLLKTLTALTYTHSVSY
jgi:hypothetical protein